MYLFVLVCIGYAHAQSVTVVQLNLPYDEIYSLELNSTVEYILDFTPSAGVTRDAPRVVWARVEGGDGSRPVLVTARQRAGAETWQLPYEVNRRKLFELERTLCPDDAHLDTTVTEQRSSYSLHVSTSSSTSVAFHVRVSIAQAWRLDAPTALFATQFAPRVLSYQFKGEENRVRLVVSSESELCATLSLQNYSCPIAQTIDSTGMTAEPRLTMMLSGAMSIARSQYPNGFYVVLVVHATDEACLSEMPIEPRAEKLWEASLAGELPSYLLPHAPDPIERRKDFLVSIQSALSRQQYVVAATVTLAIFLSFYVAFGVLVVAQRWSPFAKLVAPQAVLADNTSRSGIEAQHEQTLSDPAASPQETSRRLSTNTYDRNDDSDSEDDELATTTTAVSAPGAGPDPASVTGAGVQGPFGLPARLRVAALARQRERTIRARSDRYLYTLYTVAVFYALPVIQFVIAFQVVMNVSGSLDICYYNFLCAHPAGALGDFNHVFSNLGYLLLGALFMLQVRRRRARRRRLPRDPNYGIPAHYGLLSALGAGMMVVAILSASYHVCPNRLNFQFDTAFMYVLAVLSTIKIYQARHPDINARAHATFGVLAVIIAFVVWGVLGGGRVFWGVFTVLHVFTFLLLSLRIYYVGQLRFEKQSLAAAASELRSGARPLYGARLLLLLIANAVNWAFAIYGLIRQGSDFASHMLQVLLGNTLLYMICYLAMKLVVGERVRWYVWVLLAGATAAWMPALFFFLSGSTNWAATPAASRHSNHECKVLEFYDYHDLWHLLSAVALYLSFNTMLTWDDGLSAVKRTEIAVF
ncbi:unnamed protein product [Pieris macdunnoughi]|uniref:SID1 transmembrane family member 1 n=1 Tax=Pieris macdunnoughi TaxID=345717 RepID=A0A821VEB2_9NEOP|nr:unnamed protein product [Pieris macdunnoughi]